MWYPEHPLGCEQGSLKSPSHVPLCGQRPRCVNRFGVAKLAEVPQPEKAPSAGRMMGEVECQDHQLSLSGQLKQPGKATRLAVQHEPRVGHLAGTPFNKQTCMEITGKSIACDSSAGNPFLVSPGSSPNFRLGGPVAEISEEVGPTYEFFGWDEKVKVDVRPHGWVPVADRHRWPFEKNRKGVGTMGIGIGTGRQGRGSDAGALPCKFSAGALSILEVSANPFFDGIRQAEGAAVDRPYGDALESVNGQELTKGRGFDTVQRTGWATRDEVLAGDPTPDRRCRFPFARQAFLRSAAHGWSVGEQTAPSRMPDAAR